jgi:ubiquinone/menaquinone biosynthesis C-methylase UbiE
LNSAGNASTQWFYNDKIITSPILNEKNLRILQERVLQTVSGHYIKMYLDLGCGSCELTLFISKMVNPSEIHGVELSDSSRERASKLSICCKSADLNQSIPYPDKSFDLVSAFEIIEHLWNKDSFLKESFRIIKPGGFLIITTPNLLSFLNRVLVVFGYMPLHYNLSFEYKLENSPFQKGSHLYGHISLYSANTLKRHLESVGFQVASIDGLLLPYVTRFKFLKFINSLVSWRPSLASDILIFAKKPLSNV